MNAVRRFTLAEADFKHFSGPPGRVEIAENVTSAISSGMAGAWVLFEECSLDYEMPYDDLLYVVQGQLVIRTPNGEVTGDVGEALWVPKGVHVTFEANELTIVFCATYPVNWPELAGWHPD